MTNLSTKELQAIKDAVDSRMMGRFGNKNHECRMIDDLVSAISEALSHARLDGTHLVSCWACNNQNLRKTENGAFKCITCGELTVLDNAGTSARPVTEGATNWREALDTIAAIVSPATEFKEPLDYIVAVEQYAADHLQLEQELALLKSSRIPSGELGELLKEVERLDQAATPGPWYVEDGGEFVATKKKGVSFDVAALEDCLRQGLLPNSDQDAAFIAFARTALPRLARELSALRDSCEAQRVEIERARAVIENLHRFHSTPMSREYMENVLNERSS